MSDDIYINIDDEQPKPVDVVQVEFDKQDVYIDVQQDYAPVLAVNGQVGYVNITQENLGLSNIVYTTGNQTISGIKTFSARPTVNGTGVLLSGEAASLPTTIVYTTGNQTINGEKNFTSLKRSNINVAVIPIVKNIFDTNYPTTFWDYDTLQLPAERNVIYYIPTSWDPPKTRNIRLPRTGNFAGDSLVVSTNYMPPSSAINFYSYDPGPGWVLIDSWSNASFDGLYLPFNLSMITYQDSNVFSTPWVKQANRWNVTPPASVNSGGTPGDLSFDGTNIYVCVDQNNWRRLSASTWS